MIDLIYVENFKALRRAEIRAGKLNLYTGLNGMGKSSLIQVLLLLRQSFLQNGLSGLALNGDYIEVGTGKDAFSIAADRNDKIVFEFRHSNSSFGHFSFLYDSTSDVLKPDSIRVSDDFYNHPLFTKEFQYLNAERVGPRSFYRASSFQVREKGEIGNLGEYAVHFLAVRKSFEIANEKVLHPGAKSNQLLSQVDAWLSEITPGTRLSTDFISDAELVKLAFQFESGAELTEKFRPTNVGFGLSYILPIIVAVLMATDGSVIVIENPESHLHPKGQAKMAEFLACAASSGIQIFVETHSDHIINAIRVSVKNKSIDPADVNVYYFHRDFENPAHKTEAKPIYIDQDGRIDEWPEGFFDEWDKQLDRLH